MLWIDFAKKTGQDYLEPEDIEAIYNNQLFVSDKILEAFKKKCNLNIINTSEKNMTIPFAEFINLIEDNLKILGSGGLSKNYKVQPKTWLGENKDPENLNFRDVNRWIESLECLLATISIIEKYGLVTNTFVCSNNPTSQHFKTIKRKVK